MLVPDRDTIPRRRQRWVSAARTLAGTAAVAVALGSSLGAGHARYGPPPDGKPADAGAPASGGSRVAPPGAPSAPPPSAPTAPTAPSAPTAPKAPPPIEPIPASGAVPPMYDEAATSDVKTLALRAEARGYAKQLKAIAHRCFGSQRSAKVRANGLAELREFTDPAALRVMVEVLRGEGPDVQAVILDQLSRLGEDGQPALARYAIVQEDVRFRDEAIARITRPPVDDVLREMDEGLRATQHSVVNAAGYLAGQLNALGAIPLLIFAQAAEDRVNQTGDLAWIAIGTQISYVANVIPVVGGNAGAFQPVLGVVNQGTLLRVMDAVAITYRIDVHNALVAMTSADSGQSTASLGYNMRAWWAWFNDTYVPLKREQAKAAELAS